MISFFNRKTSTITLRAPPFSTWLRSSTSLMIPSPLSITLRILLHTFIMLSRSRKWNPRERKKTFLERQNFPQAISLPRWSSRVLTIKMCAITSARKLQKWSREALMNRNCRKFVRHWEPISMSSSSILPTRKRILQVLRHWQATYRKEQRWVKCSGHLWSGFCAKNICDSL